MDFKLGAFNTTVRDHVNYFFWPIGAQFNGETSDPSQVGAVWDLSNAPWLSYNNATRYLSGVTPDTYLNGTTEPISIPVNLTYPDTDPYPTTLYVDIQPYQFTSLTLPAVNYTSGLLNYSFAEYMRSPGSDQLWVEVFFTPPEADLWLNITDDRTGLVGTPPNTSYNSVSVELLAWDMSTNLTSTSTVLLQLRQPTTTASSTTSPIATPTATDQPTTASGATGLSKTATIALIASLCGVFLLMLCCLLVFCCCRRRRRRQQDVSVREKGIGKPVRAPSNLPPPQQPKISSASSSPTLVVHSPHADGEQKNKEKVMYGSPEWQDGFDNRLSDPSAGYQYAPNDTSTGFDHSQPDTPLARLRVMYPDAFLPSEEESSGSSGEDSVGNTPPDDSFLASESNETYLGAHTARTVRLVPADLRYQFGVTASESDQIRMIDEAVRNSMSDRNSFPEFDAHPEEVQRSRLMHIFDPGVSEDDGERPVRRP
ncbi:hypothetical protein CALCODRAFT_488753 [Calocera cornea HHB12733]|uniref:Dystroglycan-type cadherin-like domain-containing protein n=1 Tax=Calocera cornea HHB12733 TaxID=1353952 RepID=A0A165C7K5_9BASI|nr:hypothetical protein CALCODRAFT_488753 [Calocera cornea HHB12733]